MSALPMGHCDAKPPVYLAHSSMPGQILEHADGALAAYSASVQVQNTPVQLSRLQGVVSALESEPRGMWYLLTRCIPAGQVRQKSGPLAEQLVQLRSQSEHMLEPSCMPTQKHI